ncbi:hypothetical protein [Domibacillus robiginosus]|uniref:hypothetical protein n=1 Tax=Domibacillus robiginosus TaxID=1071054 RepID=UPI00067BFD25|nr:hypothetical protein [Domibacillus robiginosus]
MAYRGVIIEQQWILKEVQAYCVEKFKSNCFPYLRKQKKQGRLKRTVNSNEGLSKAQYTFGL